MWLVALRIIAGVIGLAGDTWAIIRWADKSGVTSDIALGPPEFGAIIASCTGLILFASYHFVVRVREFWLDRWTKEGKFRALADDMRDLLTILESIRGSSSQRVSGSAGVAFEILSRRLKPFGLEVPNNFTIFGARQWLEIIMTYAEKKQLSEAKLFSEIRIQQNPAANR